MFNTNGTGESGPAESGIRTYSLEEVAAMVLPPEWSDGVRWLARRLNRSEIPGYRVGRTWRMTDANVEDFIAQFSNNAVRPADAPPQTGDAAPRTVAEALSRRSRRRLADDPPIGGSSTIIDGPTARGRRRVRQLP